MSEERHELEAALNAEKEKTLQLREELVKGDQVYEHDMCFVCILCDRMFV